MDSFEKYKESPYLLTEEDARSKSLGEMIDLVKYIDKVVAETMKDLNVHLENAKTFQSVINELNEGVSK
jgi:glutaredoxin 2